MTHTIKVSRVLRETVDTRYSDLVTRPTGAAVRTSIRATIASFPDSVTILDFAEIGLVDFSCADEVVAKLLLDAPDGVFVILRGLREDHSEAIDHVLCHHDLAVVTQESPGATPGLLGHLAPDLREVLLLLYHRSSANVDSCATALSWPLERACAALDALLRRRLVRGDDSGLTFFPLALQ